VDRLTKKTFEESFSWFVDPLNAIVPMIKNLDVRRPATVMERMKKKLDASFKATTPERFTAGLHDLARLMNAKGARQRMKRGLLREANDIERRAAADDRYATLRRLIDDAERAAPFALVMYLSRGLGLGDFMRRACEPLDVINHAKSARGEIRARDLVRATREVSEMLYDPYVRFLWFLCNVIDGRRRQAPKFGAMITFLATRLVGYPGLVEPNAGWLRNAASHAHWSFVPDKDAVWMWDEHRPATMFDLKCLKKIVDRMYMISGPTMLSAAMSYVFKDIMAGSGMLDVYADVFSGLLSDDPIQQRDATAKLEAWFKEKFGPTVDLMNRTGWAKRSAQLPSGDEGSKELAKAAAAQ
jgi:hypothetical protein